MKKLHLLIAAFLTLVCTTAYAGSASINWVLPTTNTDGSAITATGPTSLTKTTVLYGICATGNSLPATPTAQDVATPATSATISNLAAGTWCFALTVTNASGMTSDPTPVATKTILPPKPMPPTSMQLADNTIYQLIGTKDKLAFLPVGTVPAATPCDASQPAGGYYLVPQAGVSVKWFGSVKPQMVFGQCS